MKEERMFMLLLNLIQLLFWTMSYNCPHSLLMFIESLETLAFAFGLLIKLSKACK